MTPEELYEATRGVWKLVARCNKARYAFAVFEVRMRMSGVWRRRFRRAAESCGFHELLSLGPVEGGSRHQRIGTITAVTDPKKTSGCTLGTNMWSPPPWLFTFLSAELFLLLVRSNDLKILVKRNGQRSPHEKRKASRGLLRSLVLEATLLVPASATLLLLIAPIVIRPELFDRPVYAGLGLVSYGFPFATVRTLVTRAAMNTLREFATIAVVPAAEDDNG